MNQVIPKILDNYLVLKIAPVIEMDNEQFFDFCQLNSDYKIERNANQELLIMPPTGSETGNRNFEIITQLGIWSQQDGTGLGFDSSTGFLLPNGAILSPDAAWIKLDKWLQIPAENRKKFAPIAPDFVIELCSESDQLSTTQNKMQEYINNGTALGWLIDRKNRQVFIYSAEYDVMSLNNPMSLNGEPILQGFTLDLTNIW